MKKYIILSIIAICGIQLQAQTEVEVKSELKKVIIFPTEAQLFKEANVNLGGNTSLLKFTQLSPFIQEKSIRVSGDGSFTILNVSYQLDYLSQEESSKKIDELRLKIKNFEAKKEDINTQIRVVNDRSDFLLSNLSMSQQTATSPAQYQELSNYFTGLMKENQKSQLELNRKLTSYNDSISVYNKQIRQLNGAPKEPTGVISVLISSKEKGNSKVDLSYRVNNASWYPSYDIRFEGLTKPLSINYKANVLQRSGNDWNEIKLSLSTAQTEKTADIPTLHPLYLGYVYREKEEVLEFNSFRGNEYKAPVFNEDSKPAYDMQPEIDADGRVKYISPEVNYGDADQSGYATVEKRDIVATVSSFSSNPIKDYSSSSLDGLQGQVGGLSITQSEGSPSSEMNIRIRGGSSITAENEPLYIVDGYPVSNINDIPTSNIASVDVLKDASATAIYGSRGANSVIVVTTKDGAYSNSKPAGSSELDKYQAAALSTRKPTTSTFEVEEAQTLKSENKYNQVPFKQNEAACVFEYKAIPKLSEKVYLIGRIPNWAELDLQNASANLYFENAFIGKTQINANSFNDTLNVSFGPDQSLSIKRDKYKDFTEKAGMGSKQQQTISWRITLKNNKAEAVKVDVYDQIPLSSQDDTSIKTLELSGGKLDPITGQVHWPVSLAAGASKELILTVEVKYPKGKRIILK